MRTLTPGDVISFMSGRFVSLFMAGEHRISQIAAAIDVARDPDGRFRTSKFLCRDITWRATLIELLHHSDLVLMDLRGFSEDNSGWVSEIQALVSQ